MSVASLCRAFFAGGGLLVSLSVFLSPVLGSDELCCLEYVYDVLHGLSLYYVCLSMVP